MRPRPNGRGFSHDGHRASSAISARTWTWNISAAARAAGGRCRSLRRLRGGPAPYTLHRRTPRYLATTCWRCACACSELSRPGRDNSTSTGCGRQHSSFWCNGCWRRPRRTPGLTFSDNIRQLQGLAAAGCSRRRRRVADGGLYRLSYGAASPLARGQGERVGRRTHTATRARGDRDLARYFREAVMETSWRMRSISTP